MSFAQDLQNKLGQHSTKEVFSQIFNFQINIYRYKN